MVAIEDKLKYLGMYCTLHPAAKCHGPARPPSPQPSTQHRLDPANCEPRPGDSRAIFVVFTIPKQGTYEYLNFPWRDQPPLARNRVASHPPRSRLRILLTSLPRHRTTPTLHEESTVIPSLHRYIPQRLGSPSLCSLTPRLRALPDTRPPYNRCGSGHKSG